MEQGRLQIVLQEKFFNSSAFPTISERAMRKIFLPEVCFLKKKDYSIKLEFKF